MKQFLFVLLCPSLVFAAAEGGAHHGGPNWASIAQQGYNLSILVIIVVVFLFPQIRAGLIAKRQNFIDESTRALKIKATAEAELSSLNQKIQELESKAQETLLNTKKEAEYLKSQFESETTAEIMRQNADAETQIKSEILRAQKELKNKLLNDAMADFKKDVENDKTEKLQGQLKQNFINNIEVAKI